MWVTYHPVTGEEMKMEDIFYCFLFFPLFRLDYDILKEAGIITHNDFDKYEWTKSKTSLAEYFFWVGEKEREKEEKNQLNIPGGFWASIEKVFGVNKRTLTKMASRNNDRYTPKKSKDFKKLRNLWNNTGKKSGSNIRLIINKRNRRIKRILRKICLHTNK